VEDRISRLTAEGGTDIYGALVKGLDGITKVPVALCTKLPLTMLSVPIEPPGLTVPPLLATLPKIEPWPESTPPVTTVTDPPRTAFGEATLPTCNAPPDTSVVPAKATLLPARVSGPAPVTVSEPLPEREPAYVPALAWLNVSAALSRMLPCRLVVLPTSVPVVIVVPPA